jgi:hypothetical protein
VDSPDPEQLRAIVARGFNREAIIALDRLFPERCPDLRDSIDEIRYKSGQRSVIRLLLSLIEQ